MVSCDMLYVASSDNTNKLKSYAYAQSYLMDYAIEQMNTVSPNTGKDASYEIFDELQWSKNYQAFTANAAVSWWDRADWFSSHKRCILWGTLIVNSSTGRFEFKPYAKNNNLKMTKSKYHRELEVYDQD